MHGRVQGGELGQVSGRALRFPINAVFRDRCGFVPKYLVVRSKDICVCSVREFSVGGARVRFHCGPGAYAMSSSIRSSPAFSSEPGRLNGPWAWSSTPGRNSRVKTVLERPQALVQPLRSDQERVREATDAPTEASFCGLRRSGDQPPSLPVGEAPPPILMATHGRTVSRSSRVSHRFKNGPGRSLSGSPGPRDFHILKPTEMQVTSIKPEKRV